jgi:hypothetical protein
MGQSVPGRATEEGGLPHFAVFRWALLSRPHFLEMQQGFCRQHNGSWYQRAHAVQIEDGAEDEGARTGHQLVIGGL